MYASSSDASDLLVLTRTLIRVKAEAQDYSTPYRRAVQQEKTYG